MKKLPGGSGLDILLGMLFFMANDFFHFFHKLFPW